MNEITKIISAYLSFSNGRTIVVYGMGKVGKAVSKEIQDKPYTCVDNNISFYDKPHILENSVQKYYVIISPLSGYDDIVDEIQKYGYKEVRDFVCLGRLHQIHELFRRKSGRSILRGNFANLEEIQEELKRLGENQGYAENNIINSVLSATQAVREGRAEYERDSVIFYKKTWNYQFLSSMYYIIQNVRKPRVNLLDFGGALGSTFYQHKLILNNIDWNIIEQEGYVKIGREHIHEISFYNNIQEYIDAGKECDVLYMSGVLMYLPNPYAYLESLLEKHFQFVLIDRTYFNVIDVDRLCMQVVPEEIYHASYPAWLLSEKRFEDIMNNNGYRRVISWFSTLENEEKEFLTLEDDLIPILGKGMLYELNN